MTKITKQPEWGVDEQHQEPYFDCPRMKVIPCCCCNACPLDPAYPKLEVLPEDPDQECKLSRSKRLAIAAKYPGVLKYEGNTVKEWNFRKAWEALSPEEKERRTAAISERTAKYRIKPRFPPQSGIKINERGGGQ